MAPPPPLPPSEKTQESLNSTSTTATMTTTPGIDGRARRLQAISTHIDRRTCRRVVPMEVLCLGMSRTGTDSMRAALEILGYGDVYHGNSTAFENPTDNYMWEEARAAKFDGVGKPFEREDWDQLLGHCMAVTDVPCTLFAPELLTAYPKALVILTTRPVESWYASVLTSQESLRRSWAFYIFNMLHPDGRLINRYTWGFYLAQYEGSFVANGKRVFEEHNAMVRRVAGGEGRLLEFRVEEGWEPLCAFLGREVPPPGVRFPRGNDKAEFEASARRYTVKRVRETAVNLLVGGLGVVGLGMGLRWFLG